MPALETEAAMRVLPMHVRISIDLRTGYSIGLHLSMATIGMSVKPFAQVKWLTVLSIANNGQGARGLGPNPNQSIVHVGRKKSALIKDLSKTKIKYGFTIWLSILAVMIWCLISFTTAIEI